MNILFIGDIVGRPGRDIVKALLPDLRKEHSLDFVIANAENAAGGSGLTSRTAQDLFSSGCDVLTLGDHVWDQKELEEHLDQNEKILRPVNFPKGVPGKGYNVYVLPKGIKIGIINALGRVFIRYNVDCPFKALDKIVQQISQETRNILIDMHAEATSEKVAMGHFMAGKASAVLGTHTHVQTADEKILDDYTAYITDVGMTGPSDSVIGQDKESIIKRFLTSMPVKFSVATGDVVFNAVCLSIDEKTGQTKAISRIHKYCKKSK